jgi:glycosyltransferase involved in cell wall biosynthesis
VKPTRILHVNTEKGWRGGEIQTLLLAKGLRQRGHSVLVVASPGSALVDRCRQAGVAVESVSMRGELDPVAVWLLARIFRRFRPEILHYHTSHAITLGTLAGSLSERVACVATRRVSFPLSRNPLARWKYSTRLDRIIAVSEGIRSVLLRSGIADESIRVITSAVDLDRFRDLPTRESVRASLGYAAEDFVVGTVGHLAGHKGHRIFVAAAGRIASVNPRLRFLIAGRGEEEGALRRQIGDLGLEKVFRLAGFSEEVAGLLPALDLFVFPSLSGEGSPAALKEAMACGLPIAASRISGIGEIVSEGVEGVLVPPGDAQALASAIVRFASDRSLALESGRRGRERVVQFGVEPLIDRTESVYREALEAQSR